MKHSTLLSLLVVPIICSSQTHQLKLTHFKKEKIHFIREGDKVLLAFKMGAYPLKKKPADVYQLSRLELADSAYVFVKGKIKTITDSTVIMRERKSFFSSADREINITKINTLRKLTAGKQIIRTTTSVAGGLAAAIAVFYSYAAVGGGEGFLSGMFYAAGASLVLTRPGRTKIPKNQLDKWKIEVVNQP